VPGDKYMNQSIKNFVAFAKNHRVEMGRMHNDTTMYCTDTGCSECVLRKRCTEDNEVGMLNYEDLEKAQRVYPEYFI
jgi:hypothetical protein